MNPLTLLSPTTWFCALVVALLLAFGVQTVRVERAHAEVAQLQLDIAATKHAATQTLLTETQKTRDVESALAKAKDQQEITDATHSQTIDKLKTDLRSATRAGGGVGLRDPNAGDRCSGDAAKTADPVRADLGHNDIAAAPGVLSQQLEDLLLSQADAADRINIAYASCRADSRALRKLLGAP